MKTRKDAQLDALMELHRQTLAVLQEALSLLKSMQLAPRQWFTLETQPSVPQPLPLPYQPYIGPYTPSWPNTTPFAPIVTCGDDLRGPQGGFPGSNVAGGMTCEGRGGYIQNSGTARTMDVVGIGG